MARHWRAAQDYAVICLASSADSASMATAAAFHQVLERAGVGAVRPQLLAAVRDTVKEWAADDAVSAVLPELRKTTGARGLRAARSVTPKGDSSPSVHSGLFPGPPNACCGTPRWRPSPYPFRPLCSGWTRPR
ncbi:hypothetical protein SALBM311S_08116 [Streptomyces alboniger]